MSCKDLEEILWLYLYDELPAERRAACESHFGACGGCRSRLDEARRLVEALNQRPAREPSPELVVECRQELDEALDREQLGWRGLLREWFGPLPGLPLSRAAGVVTLALFAFGLGWTLRSRGTQVPPAARPLSSSSFVGTDLDDLRINGITRVVPDPKTGEVRITLDAERRVTMEGSLDNPDIRRVLLYALKGYDNAGIRRDTLDALRVRSGNPSVRAALLYTLRKDPNPGVRLEALEAVGGMECGSDVHRALVEAVESDTNPGVRVAAVDALIQHATAENDKSLLPALERLAARDANSYVRLKCAAAVRKLSRDEF